MPQGKKRLYLTFDDGPHPEVTPEVLEILAVYDAKASFFCVGENVSNHPDVYQKVRDAGHLTGNHSYNHLNGWKTPLNEYYENVNKCRELVDSAYFRPPYGRINPFQIQALKNEYTIVMWTVLSYDYHRDVSPQQCTEFVLKNTNDGAIIVFHDSQKAAKNMLKALPAVLEHFKNEGYGFHRIDEAVAG